MKNPVMSFWLSSANQVASWWMAHASNAVRAQQRLALDKALTGVKPRRKRRVKARRKKALS